MVDQCVKAGSTNVNAGFVHITLLQPCILTGLKLPDFNRYRAHGAPDARKHCLYRMESLSPHCQLRHHRIQHWMLGA